jgi:peptide/nickel transport system substrate-binding protein
MHQKRLLLAFGVLTVSAMVLAACGPRPASAVPDRAAGRGGYLDEIVFSVVDSGSAVTQIQAGAIDIYGDSMAANALPAVQEAGIQYTQQNGLIYELTFNPVGPTFPGTGELNPFSRLRRPGRRGQAAGSQVRL